MKFMKSMVPILRHNSNFQKVWNYKLHSTTEKINKQTNRQTNKQTNTAAFFLNSISLVTNIKPHKCYTSKCCILCIHVTMHHGWKEHALLTFQLGPDGTTSSAHNTCNYSILLAICLLCMCSKLGKEFFSMTVKETISLHYGHCRISLIFSHDDIW